MPDDAADLLAAVADEEIVRWNPGPAGPEAASEFMASRNDWTGGGHASWAVADVSDRLVGSGAPALPLPRGRNPGSRAVAAAAGFVHEGILRESFMYSDGVYHSEHLHGLPAADLAGPAVP